MDSNELIGRLVEYGIDELPPNEQLAKLFGVIDEQEARMVDFHLDTQLLKDRGKLIDMLTALVEPVVDAVLAGDTPAVLDHADALAEAYYEMDARRAGA
jgi:hypothetical protein